VIVVDGQGRERLGFSIDDLLRMMQLSDDYVACFPDRSRDGQKKKYNPFSKPHFNVTAQARLIRINPGLASRLEAEAGASK
jgi:hypothetical protein